MTTQELESLLQKAEQNKFNAEMERLTKEHQEIQNIRSVIDAEWTPKVKMWLESLNLLAEHGYALGSPLHAEYWKVPKEQKYMCTDGVHHNFGLYGASMHKAYTHFEQMGIEQGGACGDYHIHTDGEDWWIQRGSERFAMRLKDWKELVYRGSDNKTPLERFEDRFNALIDMIKKQASVA